MATEKKNFKPQDLRNLLSVILALIILGGGALFYFGLDTVKNYAVEVNNRLKDADASDAAIKQYQTLQSQLAQNETLLAQADRMFATPDTYQAQALNDVRSYANQVGMGIAETSFDDPSSASYVITVKPTQPVNYAQLVQFLKLVEGNLPKMQTNSIDVKAVENSAELVNVNEIKIGISVR